MTGANDRGRDGGDEVVLTCPECGEVVRLPEAEAEREMKPRCKNGHTFPIAKALG